MAAAFALTGCPYNLSAPHRAGIILDEPYPCQGQRVTGVWRGLEPGGRASVSTEAGRVDTSGERVYDPATNLGEVVVDGAGTLTIVFDVPEDARIVAIRLTVRHPYGGLERMVQVNPDCP